LGDRNGYEGSAGDGKGESFAGDSGVFDSESEGDSEGGGGSLEGFGGHSDVRLADSVPGEVEAEAASDQEGSGLGCASGCDRGCGVVAALDGGSKFRPGGWFGEFRPDGSNSVGQAV